MVEGGYAPSLSPLERGLYLLESHAECSGYGRSNTSSNNICSARVAVRLSTEDELFSATAGGENILPFVTSQRECDRYTIAAAEAGLVRQRGCCRRRRCSRARWRSGRPAAAQGMCCRLACGPVLQQKVEPLHPTVTSNFGY